MEIMTGALFFKVSRQKARSSSKTIREQPIGPTEQKNIPVLTLVDFPRRLRLCPEDLGIVKSRRLSDPATNEKIAQEIEVKPTNTMGGAVKGNFLYGGEGWLIAGTKS